MTIAVAARLGVIAVGNRIKFKAGDFVQRTFVCAMAIWFSGATIAIAQPVPVEANVVRVIAQFAASTNDLIESAILEVGYSPASQSTWKSLTTIGKLEATYQAAEAASSGGGSRALAAVASKVSEKYDPLRTNTDVKSYIDKYISPNKIAFDNSFRSTLAQTTAESRDMIIRLSEISGGRLGGLYRIITVDFGLDRLEAYKILAQSDSADAALLRAYGLVPGSERTTRLQSLVDRAKRTYPQLASDRSILAFEARNSPKPKLPIFPGSRPPSLGGSCQQGYVECLCGGRPLGCVPESACIDGMPCG